MPLCNTCRDSFESIWDSANTQQVGCLTELADEFNDATRFEAFAALLLRLGHDHQDISQTVVEPERHIFGHHHSRASWEASRSWGCDVCRGLRSEADDQHSIGNTLQRTGWYSVFAVSLTTAPVMFILSGGHCEEFTFEPAGMFCPSSLALHRKLRSLDRGEGNAQHLNFHLGPSTSGPQTWDIIQTWAEECSSHHAKCHVNRGTGFIPGRILELDPAANTYRLVLATEVPRRTRYMTLSHCWGPLAGRTDILMLTQATLPHLRTARPVASLPATFRDAFEIVARFGLRHLWIDRLCILQDSAADWAAEAASMQSIYKYSDLNVAALGSSNDQGGCFRTRDPSTVLPAAICLRTTRDGDREAYLFGEDDPDWYREWLTEPLVRRAWVVQERLLSARVLHFGSRQVFWECMATRACEARPRCLWDLQPEGKSDDATGVREWKRLIEIYELTVENARDRVSGLLIEWCEHVSVYSGCDLTVAGDKLVAISGLARDMQQRLEKEGVSSTAYLAGLWKYDLPGSLLWYKKPDHVHPAPPAVYRAPSWSWAAVDGGVFVPGGSGGWRGEDSLMLAEVLRAETTAHGADELGPVIGGALTLRAPMTRPRQGRLVGDIVGTCYGPRRMLFISLVGVGVENEFVELRQEKEHLETRPRTLFDGCDVFPDWEDSCSEEQNLFCVPVEMISSMVDVSGSDELRRWLRYSGLVLTKTEESSSCKTYRRVGFFFIDFGSEYCDAVEKFFNDSPRIEVDII